MTFSMEKIEWFGYQMLKKILKINFIIFIRFERIHELDGRTDRRMDSA